MNKKLSGVLLGALCIPVLAVVADQAFAAVTAVWNVDDYKSFDKGEADSTFISSLGEVRPGWNQKHLELEFDSAWASVRGRDGSIYIGSDSDATVYKVNKGKVSKLASIKDAVAIVSLVQGNNGTLYAGTMPEGQVWTIQPKTGKSKKLATLKDVETVWSLTLDASGNSLYAGTGPEGLLYKVETKTGKSSVAFDTEDKRIMSLLTTGDGAIWMGTSDQALIFRHDLKTKKTRAIADFAGNEVTALAEWKGTVIAAATDLEPGSSSGFKSKESVDKVAKKDKPGQEAKMPKDGTKPGAEKKSPAGVEPQAKSLRKGKGALYRVRGDGHLTQLHALTSTYFTSIAVNDKGQIFAGAADKGRVYMVDEDDSVSTVIDVEQRYIADLMIDGEGLSFTTGDSTGLYRTEGKAQNPTYTSEVFDAKTPARFGRLVWHSKGKVDIETRSGNTEEPGLGWSAWVKTEGLLRGGGDSTRGKVASPTGRYLQYRATFGDDESVLRRTSLYHLPANRATRITEVSIESVEKSKGLVTMETGAKKPRSPVLKLSWKVDNEDKDKTLYDLAVRREGEIRWRPIHTGDKPLTEIEYKWNTETYPDGYYRLRVTASDRLSNTARRSLSNDWTTALFTIDNERPRVTGLSVRYPSASARATDALSTISEVAFSVDDGPWQVGGTRDGLFDDQSEIMQIDLATGLSKGTHTLALRVADSAGNIASSTTNFRVD